MRKALLSLAVLLQFVSVQAFATAGQVVAPIAITTASPIAGQAPSGIADPIKTNGAGAVLTSATPAVPPTDSTYSYSVFQNLGAFNNLVVKDSPGNVFSFKCHNLNGSTRYFQLFNKSSAVSGGDIPFLVWTIPGNAEVLIGTDYFGLGGINFSAAISFAFSTTEITYTAATASDNITFINYK